MLDLPKLLVRDYHRLGICIYRSQLHKIPLRVDQGMLQVCDHILHLVVSAVHTLLGTFQNDLLQAVRKIRRIDAGRNHFLLKMLDGNGNCGIPVKGNPACYHLI